MIALAFLAWFTAATVLGVLIGRAIRNADRSEQPVEQPAAVYAPRTWVA